MSAFVKSKNILPVVDSKKVKSFIEFSNKNRLTEKDLERCKKSAALFSMKINES